MWKKIVILIFLCAPIVTAARAESGFKVPRFVCLKPDEVNLRAGPGSRYPIKWVYRRKGLPVEVVQEYDNWRKVKDYQGESGWVFKSMIDGKRRAVVTGGAQNFHAKPSVEARVVFKAEEGVIGDIIECTRSWCKLEIRDRRGWIPKARMFGAYEEETDF